MNFLYFKDSLIKNLLSFNVLYTFSFFSCVITSILFHCIVTLTVIFGYLAYIYQEKEPKNDHVMTMLLSFPSKRFILYRLIMSPTFKRQACLPPETVFSNTKCCQN